MSDERENVQIEFQGDIDAEQNQDEEYPDETPLTHEETINDFLLKPVPRGTILKCHISISKATGYFGMGAMYPRYSMYYEKAIDVDGPPDSSGNQEKGTFILGAKKLMKMLSTKYLMTTNEAAMSRLSEGDANCMAVVTGGFSSSKFTLKGGNDSMRHSSLQDAIALVFFPDWNIPRKLVVLLPKTEEGEPIRGLLDSVVQTATVESVTDMVYASTTLLMPKWPTWNAEDKRFTQDYFGRCTAASTRNFQLAEVTASNPCDPRPTLSEPCVVPAPRREELALLTGALNSEEEKFSLDVQYPLSPVQAFAIFLASSAYKLGA